MKIDHIYRSEIGFELAYPKREETVISWESGRLFLATSEIFSRDTEIKVEEIVRKHNTEEIYYTAQEILIQSYVVVACEIDRSW